MSHDPDMVQIARRVATDLGFEPDAPHQIDPLDNRDPGANAKDLRELPWSSIDNEESRDLDQIEWAEQLPAGAIRILLGIADVAAYVPRDGEVDRHASVNTTSLYTGIKTFHMLPKALSTQRTSLLEGEERLAMVTEMVIRADGTLDDEQTAVYPARVKNHAKLIYEDVGAWLEGDAAAREPNKISCACTTKRRGASGNDARTTARSSSRRSRPARSRRTAASSTSS
jgi:exoribonuclease-2